MVRYHDLGTHPRPTRLRLDPRHRPLLPVRGQAGGPRLGPRRVRGPGDRGRLRPRGRRGSGRLAGHGVLGVRAGRGLPGRQGVADRLLGRLPGGEDPDHPGVPGRLRLRPGRHPPAAVGDAAGVQDGSVVGHQAAGGGGRVRLLLLVLEHGRLQQQDRPGLAPAALWHRPRLLRQHDGAVRPGVGQLPDLRRDPERQRHTGHRAHQPGQRASAGHHPGGPGEAHPWRAAERHVLDRRPGRRPPRRLVLRLTSGGSCRPAGRCTRPRSASPGAWPRPPW